MVGEIDLISTMMIFLCFNDSFPVDDKDGNDTLRTVQYEPSMRRDIDRALLKIYAFLRAGGDLSMMRHLVVERVDLCLYGNTKPLEFVYLTHITITLIVFTLNKQMLRESTASN